MTSTAITPPVNAYDPANNDFKDQIHRRIHTDLSSIGTVYRIEGTILAMRRYGVQLNNVFAYIEHPRLQIPLKMRVIWEESAGKISYYDEEGLEFTPAPESHYAEDPQEERDRETIDAVFARLDAHPATHDLSAKSLGNKTIGSERSLDYALVSGGGAGMVAADLITAAPAFVLPVGLLTMAVAGAGLFLSIRPAQSRKVREVNKAVEEWNRDLTKTLAESFISSHEESMFFDALYASAEAHGVRDISEVKVDSRASAGKQSLNSFYPSGGAPTSVLKDPFRRPMLSMRATSRAGRQAFLFWDGIHFYRFVSRGESGYDRYFSVLGVKPTLGLLEQSHNEAEERSGYISAACVPADIPF